jgi:hypothetical protein
MKLTKLSAAWLPAWTCRLMPAPSRLDAGTASQLIPGVRQTYGAGMARPSLVVTLARCALAALALGASSCGRDRDAELIHAYSAASCVSPVIAADVQPPSRQWHRPIALLDGRRVVVMGVRAPGGAISLLYSGMTQPAVAANGGDYVYPSDVRWDRDRNRLYVKAQGVSAAGGERTVLFEYDLAAQREVRRKSVEPGDLPAECPTEQASTR